MSFILKIYNKLIKPKCGGICSHRSSNAVSGLTSISIIVQAVLMSEAQLNPQYFLKKSEAAKSTGRLFLTSMIRHLVRPPLQVHFIESSVGQMLRSRHEDQQDRIMDGGSKNAGCSESSKSHRWTEYANPKLHKNKFVWNFAK